MASDAKAAGVRPLEAIFGLAFLLLGLWTLIEGRAGLGLALLVLGALWVTAACWPPARRALLAPLTKIRS